MLYVSHDRYFLDKVTTKTVLIERGKEILVIYEKENDSKTEGD